MTDTLHTPPPTDLDPVPDEQAATVAFSDRARGPGSSWSAPLSPGRSCSPSPRTSCSMPWSRGWSRPVSARSSTTSTGGCPAPTTSPAPGRRWRITRRWYAPYSTATSFGHPAVILDWCDDDRCTETWVLAYVGDDNGAAWLPLSYLTPTAGTEEGHR